MKWMGRGLYRVWKNRIPGTNYGVWHKEYNNTITGESFENLVYPEFKGYHANMYWATLESDTTPFTIYSRNDGIFFHVFTTRRTERTRKDTMPKFPEGIYPSCWTSRLFAPLNQSSNKAEQPAG